MERERKLDKPHFIDTITPSLVLKITCFVIFIGRGYQHLFWDGPYRSIFWDEAFFSGFVQNVFGLTWKEFVESETMDFRIQTLIKSIGVLFILAGFSSMFYKRERKGLKAIIIAGIVFLGILAVVSFKSKFFQFSQGFEFGIQLFSPIILLWSVAETFSIRKLISISKIAIAITFVGHGVYAVGIFPQPGYFVDMTISVLHFSEDHARLFLEVMGVADFVFAILLFIPKTSAVALIYCVIWGLLTASARIVAGFNIDFPLQTIHQWGFETVYRLSHGLLPLWTYLIYRTQLKR